MSDHTPPAGAPARASRPHVVGKVLRDVFTERDGQTYDINRFTFALAVLSFLGMAAWAIVHNHQPMNWAEAGGGIGVVLGAGSGGLALNRHNQAGAPGADPPA